MVVDQRKDEEFNFNNFNIEKRSFFGDFLWQDILVLDVDCVELKNRN